MVTLRPDVVRAPTQYGAVLLHIDNGRYWTLNPSGDLVLRILLDGGDTAAAVRGLCETSEVDPETARRDVEGLLAQLADVGLIEAEPESRWSPETEAVCDPRTRAR
ncbi:lasso peptide biosynthesis PqqD family chaperone [Frankia sp. B2]|uniref:lasso peptide biosynthesis PqqD family chaperone n=1 Tax=unclassified Frankia TaxID=2632575 RepID=UPI000460D87D|nr:MULTISPECIES: lasso peptide biosynthesis PqqD family chaperone [unclassified Frankia]KDA44839.1 hypothetical protein BMG523Draft_00363 [Frankia sp. BMG5.23]KEZ35793.1 Coenzyme PQQ synthesis protein D (PqqD) [Frankia sp. CeD]ORT51636.1 hypothetical protein KBI5_11060 [Frankia sp. KB5]TFE28747.1 lasso peptide biosynthesis PqqD family chaperone [Frankia sp. B2]